MRFFLTLFIIIFFLYGFNYKDINPDKDKLLIVDNIEKPLKNISSYKKIDIINMANKLNINIMKDVKKIKVKKILYQEISEALNT